MNSRFSNSLDDTYTNTNQVLNNLPKLMDTTPQKAKWAGTISKLK